jgi:hypothetical protein
VRSQNATFVGPPVGDPPGKQLALQLQAGVAADRWGTADFDGWRELGWIFTCKRGPSELFVAITPEHGWFVQITRWHPGLLLWLFGMRPSATPAEIHCLATGNCSLADSNRHPTST